MKYKKLSFAAAFVAMILATVLVLCFNKFLFILHGYNPSLAEGTEIETFTAYKAIYKSKLVFMLIGLLVSLLATFFSNKGSQIIFFISILLSMFFVACLVLYFIVPNRIF